MNNYIEPPKPNYEEREPHWSPMPFAEGIIDVWVGGDASHFPEVLHDLSSVELACTPWVDGNEIVVNRAEDDDYVYITHSHPSAGGDTGTVFRYYKTFD